MTDFRTSKFKKLTRDTFGGVAVYAAITAPVMVGGAALSVDVARLHNLDQQLQSASDAYARAAAAELDGRADSIARANRAINTLVKNDQTYAASKSTVSISAARFLKELPPNDYDAIPASYVTTNPNEAKYVEISVAPTQIDTLFPAKISRGITAVTLDAKSTAGFDFGVCGAAPVFVCNPYEGTGMNLYQALEQQSERRRQIKFLTPGGGCEEFAPGVFGFLDPYSKNGVSGANIIRDKIAIDKTDTCFQSSGVKLRPGRISSVADAVNVRFDIYKGRYKRSSYMNDPAFAPATNVTKGYGPKWSNRHKKYISTKSCDMVPNDTALAMPRDACFENGTCTDMGGNMGNGNWDFLRYMEVNHNRMRTITIADTTYHFNYGSRTVTPSNLPSRYEMYRWEIDNDCVPGALTYGRNAKTPEEGRPTCHATGAYEGDIDRRVITVAVLNCDELSMNFNMHQDSREKVPAEAFIDVFITEPMARGNGGNDGGFYGEMVGTLKGDSTLARDRIAMAR